MDDARLQSLLKLNLLDYEPRDVEGLVWVFGQRRWWQELDAWIVPIEATFDYRGQHFDRYVIGWEPQDDNGNRVERR